VYSPRDLLIINVGFIAHQTVGYSRDFPFEAPYLRLEPDLELYDFSGQVRVTRTGQGLLLQAALRALIQVACARCLKEFQQLIDANFTELYAFTRASMTESGLLVPETGKINLEPIVRDEMLLAVPIGALCKPDCKGLCPVCGEDMNEVTCSHETETYDPRLDALKLLLEKGSKKDKK
jgi:uncharacterized protein